MSPSRNRQLAVVAVAAVASIAAGAAYAATKLHSSPRGAANAPPVGRVFASSSSSTTTPPRFDGDHHGGPGHHHGDELAAAASYLGLTQAELLTQLQSGKTLAQVADGTSGKSKAGLIDALVKAETAE